MPDHAVLAIAGDISMAEARKLVEREARRLEEGGHAGAAVGDPPATGPAQVSLHRAAQLGADESLRSARRRSRGQTPTTTSLTVMNAVIGGGPTGRLFTHLREEKGYTYGAYSNVDRAASIAGPGPASTDVRTEVTDPALTRLDGRDRADARRARAGEGVRGPQAGDGRVVRAVARNRRGGARTTTSRAGSTSCRPTTGTSYPERIMAVTGRRCRPPRRSTSIRRGCRSSPSATQRRSARF